VYVLSQVESENRQGASAMSVVMLAISLSLVLLVDWLRARSQKGMVAE
jgi:ABC-type sulfate transport system permease component